MSRRFFLFLLLLALTLTDVSAHAFFVTGEITTTPTPAPVSEEFILQIEMTDPSGAPVEDAVVAAEFSKDGERHRFDQLGAQVDQGLEKFFRPADAGEGDDVAADQLLGFDARHEARA